MTNKKIVKIIFNLPFSNKEKLFCLLRHLSAPFSQLEEMVPKKASVLDVGCGHGVFDLILKNGSSKRTILGIDLDKNKIALAKNLKISTENDLVFKTCSLFSIDKQKFDCVMIIDVDYLLKESEKRAMLEKAKKLLQNNGRLLIKTVVKNNSIGYYLGLIQELVTVHFVKKTFTKNDSFYFFTTQQYLELIKSAGFKIEKHGPLKRAYHPHYYFLAKK